MVAGGVCLHRRGRGHRGHDAGQPRGVRQPPDRAAHAARRVAAGHVGRALRAPSARTVPARADRRRRDGPSGRRPATARAAAGEGVPMVFRTRRPWRWSGWRRSWATARAGFSSTGARRTSSWRASSRVPSAVDAKRSSSRSTPRCSAGARATSTSASCRFCAGWGSPIHQRPGVPAVGGGQGSAAPRRRGGPAAATDSERPVDSLSLIRRRISRESVQRFVEIYAAAVAQLGRPALPARADQVPSCSGASLTSTTHAVRSTSASTA